MAYTKGMTDRQLAILSAIIEQYAEIAVPVGSVTLAKLFGVSSATIRSEMARLEEMGLIMQPHTSAGRIPTDQGYRLYVNTLTAATEAAEPPKLDRSARAIEARVATHGDRADRAIRSAVDSLVELTQNLGIATIGDELYMNGIGNLFSQPEYFDGKHVQAVARLLDNLEPWLREAAPNEPLNVYIGSENPIGKTSGATLIISRFRSPFSDRSYIGVLGPTRQSYGKVMRLVRHAGAMLEEVL
jgi:heat-inducible transcriptional repressor